MSNKVQFGTLNQDGTLSNVRLINQSDMMKCPHIIMVSEHYRDNGSCRCDDSTHKEMAEWGYTWSETYQRWLNVPDKYVD